MSELILLNPRKRGHRKSAKRRNPRKARHSRKGGFMRLSNPKRRYHHRRHNPIGGLKVTVQDAALVAGGAVILDLAMGYLPLPAMVSTPGPLNYAAKAAVALGLGMGAEKVLGSQRGGKVADGMLAIVIYQAAKAGITSALPAVGAKMGALQPFPPNPTR